MDAPKLGQKAVNGLSVAEFALNRIACRAKLRVDALDYALFLPSIGLVCGLGNSVGLIGPLFVIIPISSCLLYGILRRTVPPRLAAGYIGFCLVVAALSALRLMPASWQLYFLHDAVVRQLIPPLSWFAVAWASKAFSDAGWHQATFSPTHRSFFF